jgi:hypothetical protein
MDDNKQKTKLAKDELKKKDFVKSKKKKVNVKQLDKEKKI